jgi:hypothetical protein
MDEKPSDPSKEPGLHEYVDAEFNVTGLESPGREKALRDTLQNLPGLERLNILHGKVTAHYEPVLLSKKELEEAIQRAGFQISEAEATASSPLTDAFAEENKSSGTI